VVGRIVCTEELNGRHPQVHVQYEHHVLVGEVQSPQVSIKTVLDDSSFTASGIRV
jgi:hypothetical protein